MPELPEVENVKRSLESLGTLNQEITGVELRRKNLRTPLRSDLREWLPGERILSIERRAKYLLFHTERFVILNHLGMTGSWRAWRADDERAHDHVILNFKSGLRLVFHDPRRFGVLEVARDRGDHRWLNHLGLEPLDDDFSGPRLFELTRRRFMPIKTLIMDQRFVVGVGNIYASEALHRAAIRPSRAAARLSRREADALVDVIKAILTTAIAAGGSTIRDYRDSNGAEGSFQKQFAVYDRAGEPCETCRTPIKSKMINQRNTFWCPRCQR